MCLFSTCPKNICPMSIVQPLVIWLTPSFVCSSDLRMSSCPMHSWPYFGFLSYTIDNAFYLKHLCILWLWPLHLLFLGFLFYQNDKCTLSVFSSSCGLMYTRLCSIVPYLSLYVTITTTQVTVHQSIRCHSDTKLIPSDTTPTFSNSFRSQLSHISEQAKNSQPLLFKP